MVATDKSDRPALYTARYNFSEADRLARVTRGTAKRWVSGHTYRRPDGTAADLPPVTPRAQNGAGVSFIELIEMAATVGLRDLGWSLTRIRKIVVDCGDLFSAEHPLAMLRFKTDGREIFVSGRARWWVSWAAKRSRHGTRC